MGMVTNRTKKLINENIKMKNFENLNYPDCIELLDAMKKSPHHYTWAEYGRFIRSIRNAKYKEEYDFTMFMQNLAKTRNVCETSIWRYYNSYNFFYIVIHTCKNSKTINLPKSMDELSKISPENIEYLAKLHTVLPHNEYISLVKQICNFTISRDELRKLWSIYKPLVQGKSLSTIRKNGSINKSELKHATVLDALQGYNNVVSLPKSKMFITEDVNRKHRIDCLIMTEMNNEICYHAFHIVKNGTVKVYKNSCDFLWLVCTEDTKEYSLRYNNSCGVITVYEDKNLDIVRPAVQLLDINKQLITNTIMLGMLK